MYKPFIEHLRAKLCDILNFWWKMSSFTNSFDSEIVLLGGNKNKIRPSVQNLRRGAAHLSSEPGSDEDDLHIKILFPSEH